MSSGRAVLGALALVVAPVLVVGACSSDDDDPAAGSRDAFCTELRVAIEDDLTVFDPLQPVSTEDTTAALERLTAAAPAAIVDDLEVLTASFRAVSGVLADAEASDPATADRLEALDLDLDQIAAAQLAVATYSLDECRIDLAAINAASVTTSSTTPPTLPPATAPPSTAPPTTVPPTTAAG